MGKLKVLEPSLDWAFTLILSAKTNRTIVSHVSYPSRKCTSLFDLNFSELWIYIGFVSSSNIHWYKEKKGWSTLLLIMPVLKVFLQKRETRRLPPKGVSTSGSTLSTFFLIKFLREGQCSTALSRGNNFQLQQQQQHHGQPDHLTRHCSQYPLNYHSELPNKWPAGWCYAIEPTTH